MQDYFKKNPATVMVLIAILLVAVGAISFYLGRSNGIEQSQTPIAQNGSGPMQAVPGAAGQRLVRLPPKKFENWALACVKTPKNLTRCSLMLRAVSKDTKKLLMTLAVSRAGNGKPIMVVVTPPGALLSAGVRLTPGSAKEMTARFIQCGRGACEAAMLLDDAAVTAFSNAPTTTVGFVAGNGKPLGLKLPTGGFAAGYAAWELAMPAPPASATAPAQSPAQEPSNTSPGTSEPAPSTPQNQ